MRSTRETFHNRVLGTLVGVLLLMAGPVLPAAGQVRLSWWDRTHPQQVGHYWIKSDLPADYAGALARHLNTMYAEYDRRLASLPPRAPESLNVLIFQRRRDYLQTLQRRYGVDGTATGGLFFVTPSSGHALALWTEGLARRRILSVLQHEGFHQFAYSRFGGDLPVWVNEGLAEFFGEAIAVGRTLMAGGNNPRVIEAVKDSIELGTSIPFEKMLAMSSRRWAQGFREGTAMGQYQQAWSMVHFLITGDNGRYVDRFETYLRLLHAGFPSQHSFVKAFQTSDIEAFERRWQRHALAARPSGFLAALQRIEFLAEGALELSRRGVSPESLVELRDALVAAGFSLVLHRHAQEIELPAQDEAMYRIPGGRPGEQPPVFVVRKAALSSLTEPRRRPEDDVQPTPPSIHTEYLRPFNASIRWRRDPDTNELSYEIIVR